MRRLLSLGILLAVGWSMALEPDQLMCELLGKPALVALNTDSPRFSWTFKDAAPGEEQSAYQIQVATSTFLLRKGTPDLWDSGMVKSAQSLYVLYGGAALPGRLEVCWRVRLWNRRGRVGEWSLPRSFLSGSQESYGGSLHYQPAQTRIKPQTLITNAAGNVFIDFGRAAFGWVELVPPFDIERAGDFVLHFGERASSNQVERQPGGSLCYHRVQGALTSPAPYRVPVQGAQRAAMPGTARAAIVPAAGEVAPFRYLELEQVPYDITSEGVRQIALHYPFDGRAAAFTSSSRHLDLVYNLCKYSVKATSFGEFYLTGERDRWPSELEGYVNQLSHYAVDCEYTLARHTLEYLLRNPSPLATARQQLLMMFWQDWCFTADRRFLERHYGQIKNELLLEELALGVDGLLELAPSNQVDALKQFIDDPLAECDNFVSCPLNAPLNAFYVLNLRQISELAAALGKTDEAAVYLERSHRVARAFHQTFYDSARGCYRDGSETTHASLHANILPLAFGLVPEAEVGRVSDFIIRRGMQCSPTRAQFMLEALFKAGAAEQALELLTGSDLRSWCNMMLSGSTITTEAWDLKLKPHGTWSSAGAAAPANIIPRFILGVRPLEAGFGEVLIQPQVGSLEAVEGYVPTIRGRISVGIRQQPGDFYKLSLRLPVNTRARVELPHFEGGFLFLDDKRVTPTVVDGRLCLEGLVSGAHEITWSLKKKRFATSSLYFGKLKRRLTKLWR